MTKVENAVQHVKIPRSELVRKLVKRDGLTCQHPDCGKRLDLSLIGADDPREPTIDHWIPQSWAFDNGWTYEKVWDLSNLKLMHKRCNAKKGSLLPNADGTLPARPGKTFQPRRDKRATRPEICESCNSGRLIDLGQTCPVCGSGPQPEQFPALYKVSPKECPHEGPWSCWSCVLESDIRTPAIVDVLDGGILEDEDDLREQ